MSVEEFVKSSQLSAKVNLCPTGFNNQVYNSYTLHTGVYGNASSTIKMGNLSAHGYGTGRQWYNHR